MIDFHSHILPGIDDGADSVETSLGMLRESARQGVDVICATSHFYADEMDPKEFLFRRNRAYDQLREAIGDGSNYPRILLGAEVLYFPGISVADEIRGLCLEGTPFLLIEPPMIPWSDSMLEEIELCGESLSCIPVIAHLDRYMRILDDYSLFDRLNGRRLLIQVNASFFLHRRSRELALACLREDRFQFVGTDCHNLYDRAPNMGEAAQVIRSAGLTEQLSDFQNRLYMMFNSISQTMIL